MLKVSKTQSRKLNYIKKQINLKAQSPESAYQKLNLVIKNKVFSGLNSNDISEIQKLLFEHNGTKFTASKRKIYNATVMLNDFFKSHSYNIEIDNYYSSRVYSTKKIFKLITQDIYDNWQKDTKDSRQQMALALYDLRTITSTMPNEYISIDRNGHLSVPTAKELAYVLLSSLGLEPNGLN